MRLVWLDAALNDLAAIRGYIARDDPAAAGRMAERIVARVNRLPGQPHGHSIGVIAGLDPAIHPAVPGAWMPGSSPGMTT